jgi:hypothetical protein
MIKVEQVKNFIGLATLANAADDRLALAARVYRHRLTLAHRADAQAEIAAARAALARCMHARRFSSATIAVGGRRFIALDDDDEAPSLLARWRVYIIDDVDDCTMTESVDARARVSEPSAYNVASSLVQAACALLASATGASVELLATERPTTYLSA